MVFPSFDVLAQQIANGISLGSLYALIAIGYTMVYGIIRLINFAHGDIFMVALYAVFYGVVLFMLPWWLALIFAIVVTVILGVVIERLAYRPLRGASKISILISAIGVSFLLENLATVVFGGVPKTFPSPAELGQPVAVGGVSVPVVAFVIPVVAVVCLAGLVWIVDHTKTGMAMRAVSKDYTAARLMAIDVDHIVSITFVIGSALAAVGGILWGIKYVQISPLMGIMPGLKCFIAAVIGGIGNIRGAMLGGFLLGMLEMLLVAFFPALTGYRDALAFVLLIVLLLARPEGLMGEKLAEKV